MEKYKFNNFRLMRDLKNVNNILDAKEEEAVKIKVIYEQKIKTLRLKLEEQMYCRENLVEELSSSYRKYNQVFKNENQDKNNKSNRTTNDFSHTERTRDRTNYDYNYNNTNIETDFNTTSKTSKSLYQPYQSVNDLRNIVNSIDLKLSKSMGLNCDGRISTNESIEY